MAGIGRNIHFLAVDENMAVIDELSRGSAGSSVAQTINQVIQSRFQQLHECRAGDDAFDFFRFQEQVFELSFGNAVSEAQFLLFNQLLAVFGRFLLAGIAVLTRSVRTFRQFFSGFERRIT